MNTIDMEKHKYSSISYYILVLLHFRAIILSKLHNTNINVAFDQVSLCLCCTDKSRNQINKQLLTRCVFLLINNNLLIRHAY